MLNTKLLTLVITASELVESARKPDAIDMAQFIEPLPLTDDSKANAHIAKDRNIVVVYTGFYIFIYEYGDGVDEPTVRRLCCRTLL